MSKPLVVVESPTKIKTLQKVLGSGYAVAATVGHIKDLPPNDIGIDIQDGFKPQYSVIPGKEKVISALKKAAGNAVEIYLAPDPDREGEAIAWHTAEILQKKNRQFHRVLFHELTHKAILEAIQHPQALNPAKFEAQQARRILDRLVGYQVSPLLWRKVKRGLSAGRVQSVAVRIICDRERSIQAFVPQEYWSITAHLAAQDPPVFPAKLVKCDGKKLGVPDEPTATGIIQELKGAQWVVQQVTRKTTRRNPQPPFTTSKLQQEAIRKLRLSAQKTMRTAQELYEGIELGPGEPVGLITYMRTDSTRIAQEAALEALDYIRSTYGQEYAQPAPRYFKNSKKAQDAHEAIRPTAVERSPESLARYLTPQQLALYTLIWKRFVASQMTPALIDNTTVQIIAGRYGFQASGSIVKFPGFMSLYQSVDDEDETEKQKGLLPPLTNDMVLNLQKLEPKQHFTQPPPRFNEASLVKELEENGIGRPSTYATILSTIRDKGYVELLKTFFIPTELGFLVNDLVVASFPDIFEVEFTAHMEEDLDRIEQTEANALDILTRFYATFQNRLNAADAQMLNLRAVGAPTPLTCPRCQSHPLHIRYGKNGPFLACKGYPECNFSSNYQRNEKGEIEIASQVVETMATEEVCDQCGKPMVIRNGRYGPFLACSGYPQCRNTRRIQNGPESGATEVACPQPGCTGQMVTRKSRQGRTFYSCSRYPDCQYAIWDKPVPKACPLCGASFLVEKTTRREGVVLACLAEGCGYKEKA